MPTRAGTGVAGLDRVEHMPRRVMGTASGARPQRATWLILLRPPDNASGVEADHCLTCLPVVVDDSYRSASMFAWVEGVGFKGGHVGKCLRV